MLAVTREREEEVISKREREKKNRRETGNEEEEEEKMHVARASRLFMLTTSVCFCPVLASTRAKARLLLHEQNNIIIGRE